MYVWAIVWDRNKAIDIGKWSIFGSGRLERFYCSWIPHYDTDNYYFSFIYSNSNDCCNLCVFNMSPMLHVFNLFRERYLKYACTMTLCQSENV